MTHQHAANNTFNAKDLEQIHNASMRILQEQGIVIDSDKVLAVFNQHGFKVQGSRIFLPNSRC